MRVVRRGLTRPLLLRWRFGFGAFRFLGWRLGELGLLAQHGWRHPDRERVLFRFVVFFGVGRRVARPNTLRWQRGTTAPRRQRRSLDRPRRQWRSVHRPGRRWRRLRGSRRRWRRVAPVGTVASSAGTGGTVSGAVEGASNAAGSTGVAPVGVAGLLDSPNFTAPATVRTWLQSGGVDPRVVSMLDSVLAHHTIGVSNLEVLSTPVHVQSFDIVSVDGQPVGPDNFAARDLVTEIAAMDPTTRPDEIGTPWPIQSPGFFTGPASANGLHLAFEAPGTNATPPKTPATRDRHRPTPTPNELRHRRPTGPRRPHGAAVSGHGARIRASRSPPRRSRGQHSGVESTTAGSRPPALTPRRTRAPRRSRYARSRSTGAGDPKLRLAEGPRGVRGPSTGSARRGAAAAGRRAPTAGLKQCASHRRCVDPALLADEPFNVGTLPIGTPRAAIS